MIYYLIHFFIFLPILVFVLFFAVVNKAPVTLSFVPFPVEVTLPFSFVLLGVAFLFFVLGGFFMWIQSLKSRQLLRAQLKIAAFDKKNS